MCCSYYPFLTVYLSIVTYLFDHFFSSSLLFLFFFFLFLCQVCKYKINKHSIIERDKLILPSGGLPWATGCTHVVCFEMQCSTYPRAEWYSVVGQSCKCVNSVLWLPSIWWQLTGYFTALTWLKTMLASLRKRALSLIFEWYHCLRIGLSCRINQNVIRHYYIAPSASLTPPIVRFEVWIPIHSSWVSSLAA